MRLYSSIAAASRNDQPALLVEVTGERAGLGGEARPGHRSSRVTIAGALGLARRDALPAGRCSAVRLIALTPRRPAVRTRCACAAKRARHAASMARGIPPAVRVRRIQRRGVGVEGQPVAADADRLAR